MKLAEQRKQILVISQKLIQAGVIHDGQGNISIYDRESGLVAMTPSAVPYDQRKAEDICVIDLAGELVEGSWKPTSEKALHLVYYRNRPDVNAVIHTHAPKATVFGVIGTDPMPMIINEAAVCLGQPVPIAPYAKPGTEHLAEVTCEATGNGYAAIMAHHGLISVGPTLERAYIATVAVESTAGTIIAARSMGCEPIPLADPEVRELHALLTGYKPQQA